MNDLQPGRTCSLRPHVCPWWNGKESVDTGTTLLLDRYDHPGEGFRFFFSFFEEMVDRFGVQHIKTAIHSPQSNAAMRVNRNVLAM